MPECGQHLEGGEGVEEVDDHHRRQHRVGDERDPVREEEEAHENHHHRVDVEQRRLRVQRRRHGAAAQRHAARDGGEEASHEMRHAQSHQLLVVVHRLADLPMRWCEGCYGTCVVLGDGDGAGVANDADDRRGEDETRPVRHGGQGERREALGDGIVADGLDVPALAQAEDAHDDDAEDDDEQLERNGRVGPALLLDLLHGEQQHGGDGADQKGVPVELVLRREREEGDELLDGCAGACLHAPVVTNLTGGNDDGGGGGEGLHHGVGENACDEPAAKDAEQCEQNA